MRGRAAFYFQFAGCLFHLKERRLVIAGHIAAAGFHGHLRRRAVQMRHQHVADHEEKLLLFVEDLSLKLTEAEVQSHIERHPAAARRMLTHVEMLAGIIEKQNASISLPDGPLAPFYAVCSIMIEFLSAARIAFPERWEGELI